MDSSAGLLVPNKILHQLPTHNINCILWNFIDCLFKLHVGGYFKCMDVSVTSVKIQARLTVVIKHQYVMLSRQIILCPPIPGVQGCGCVVPIVEA